MAPRRVLRRQEARVLATIAGFGAQSDAHSVSLVLNGRVVETKSVDVPEVGRATVEFLSLDVPYGRNKGEVRIDSGRSAARRRHLLFFGRARRSAPRALRPRSRQQQRACSTSRPRSKPPANPPSISTRPPPSRPPTSRPPSTRLWCSRMSASLPGGFENQLRDYVRGGGSVLMALGHHSMAPTARCRSSDERHRRGALLRPRRRALPDRRLARRLASRRSTRTTTGTT